VKDRVDTNDGEGPGVSGTGPGPAFFADFIELVYGVFFSPVTTLRAVAQRPRPPFGVALFAFILVAAINGLASAATARGSWQSLLDTFSQTDGLPGGLGAGSDLAFGGGFVLLIVCTAVLWGPIGLFFKAGALNLMSSFLGGRGEPSRLFALLGLTYLPALAAVPVVLISAGYPGLRGLATALGLGILVWRLILDIIAIREVHGFGTGKAVGAALIPLGTFVVLLVLVAAVSIGFFASLLGPLLQSGLPGVG